MANSKGLERRCAMRTNGCSRLTGLVLVVLLTVIIGSPALGHDRDRCTVDTLEGLYVFTATSFSVPTPPTPALPKAIIELIRFNGDGTLTVPGATVSLNGVLPSVPPGGTGTYTVARDEAFALIGGRPASGVTGHSGHAADGTLRPAACERALLERHGAVLGVAKLALTESRDA
jgi:hypothetical protein